ncbi:MAG: hypothetical protein HRU22_08710 [Gammaproteobacteria bacterium]|nr:hypothetical protein [Gammaproteobacteria bacterium]
MNISLLKIYSIILAGLLLSATALAQESQSFQLSGFGRLVAGVSEHQDINNQPYDSQFSIKPNSLIAVQADWQFSTNWAATAQVITIKTLVLSGFI